MAFPKKSARLIEIAGQSFQWRVKITNHQAVLSILPLQKGAKLLTCTFPDTRLYTWKESGDSLQYTGQALKIGPGIVREVISRAINQGWKPFAPGQKALQMTVSEGDPLMQPDGKAISKPDENPSGDGAFMARLQAQQTVDDLRFDLSLNPIWREKLFHAPFGTRFPIDAQGANPAEGPAQPKTLQFAVYASQSPEKWVFFHICSVNFPDIETWTFNNPKIIDW